MVRIVNRGVEETRSVLVNGREIGTIHFGWRRMGGQGWTHSNGWRTYRAMRDAAESLARWTGDVVVTR